MRYLFLALIFIGCNETDYGYVGSDTSAKQISTSFTAVNLITESDPTDILWIVDNSGSMDNIQQNIIKNTEIFMKEFVVKKTINWKMGLISTDYDFTPDDPYLGFLDDFDYLSADPVQNFQTAVTSLGTSGSGTETMMEPMLEHLKKYPNFLRSEAQLSVIMVTDEREQTKDSYITKEDFLAEIYRIKGSKRMVRFYAIVNAVDLNCPGASFDELNYFGSKYEYLVNETGGSYFRACAVDFGSQLSKISEDIVSSLVNSKYYLSSRPRVNTIKVYFEGEEITALNDDGQRRWFYNSDLNCLVFTDLSFFPLDEDGAQLKVTYDEDNGF